MTIDRSGQLDSGPPGELPVAALLRLAADGENLSPELSAALESHLRSNPDDRARIEFERELRRRVKASMAAGAPARAPEELRRRILALAASPDSRSRNSPVEHAPRSRFAPPVRLHRRRRRITSIVSVAAVLALCATLVVFAWRSSVGTGNAAPSPGGSTLALAPAAQTSIVRRAQFVEREHIRCADFMDAFENKFKARTWEEARAMAADVLKHIPSALDLQIGGPGGRSFAEAGYEFAGLGKCGVPGRGGSVHLIYRPVDARHRSISLFIQEDKGDLDIDESASYVCPCEVPEQKVMVWRQEGFIYYLFAPDEESMIAARKGLAAPDRTIAL